jgi:site-specific DNA recombinase
MEPVNTSGDERPAVGILIRVSTKRQGERGASTDTQRDDCLAYAERQGWRVELVEEDHESGTGFDRAGYQRLLVAAKLGRIVGVLVRDLSRFGRGDLGATDAEFKAFLSAGCFIAAILDNVIMQPTELMAKRLDVGVKILVNNYYSAMLAENVPPNMARRVREGKWVSSAPFGYRLASAPDGKGKMLEPDPATAWAIPKIFAMAAQGATEVTLVEFARTNGLRASRNQSGKTLTRTSIGRMLENPAYDGKVVWNRRGHGRFRQKGKRPESEIVTADGLHPALVDAETFRQVQARRAERKTYKTYAKKNVVLLDGLVYCGRCGARMRGASNATKGRRYQYYLCANKHDLYSCDQPSVSAQRLDEEVRAVIQRAFDVSDITLESAVEILVKRRESLMADTGKMRARLETQQKQSQRKLERILNESVSEDLTKARREGFQRLLKVCEGELEAIQHDLDRLRPEDAQQRDIDEMILGLKTFARAEKAFVKWGKDEAASKMRHHLISFARYWSAYDPTAWQRVARQFISRVELVGNSRNAQVRVEWSATAQSILGEQVRVLQFARTVRRTPGERSAVRSARLRARTMDRARSP